MITILIDYTNHRGERNIRKLSGEGLSLEKKQKHLFYPGRWYIRAWDLDKSAYCEFVLTGIHAWRGVAEDEDDEVLRREMAERLGYLELSRWRVEGDGSVENTIIYDELGRLIGAVQRIRALEGGLVEVTLIRGLVPGSVLERIGQIRAETIFTPLCRDPSTGEDKEPTP